MQITPEAVDAFLKLGVPGLLVVALIALVLEIVVSGRAYKRVLAERDEAFKRTDRLLDVVEATTGVKVPR